jgi:hypothetical protein
MDGELVENFGVLNYIYQKITGLQLLGGEMGSNS